MNEQVAYNCAEVMDVFVFYQKIAEEQGVEKALFELRQRKIRYQSVGYESISMFLANAVLESATQNWDKWNDFYEKHSEQHAAQLQVGLGWACAKSQKTSWEDIKKRDIEKLLDGYGYFHGIFRSRSTIKSVHIPDEVKDKKLAFFDRGLGRSLWYLSKGNLAQLDNLLCAFESNRKENLFQGIGLASAFVGGLTCTDWGTLLEFSNEYKSAVKRGILQANHSCFLNQTQQREMELVMHCVFQSTPQKGFELSCQQAKASF